MMFLVLALVVLVLVFALMKVTEEKNGAKPKRSARLRTPAGRTGR